MQDSTQTSLETALLTAQQNLAQLTTPEAIANAKLAITTDQTNVTNAANRIEQFTVLAKRCPGQKLLCQLRAGQGQSEYGADQLRIIPFRGLYH